jgi:hypothetical protein
MSFRALCMLIFGLSLIIATPLAGMLAADHLYDHAVESCATFGGSPAGVQNRLTYVCVTPEGMTITP